VRYRIYITFLAFLFGIASVCSQEKLTITENVVIPDTINKTAINPLAPARAAFYSAILPGLGQAYNKKYWKIPIVYAALGTGVYSYMWNNKKYNSYRDAYKQRLAGKEDDFQYLDDARLIQGQKFYQKNRDLSAIITVALYILNIVEANVNAHLLQFNVNDKLTFRPEMQQNDGNAKQNVGVALSYQF
jgi:hypothetical protein